MLSLPSAPSLGEQPLSLCETANCTPARSPRWSWIYFGVRNKKHGQMLGIGCLKFALQDAEPGEITPPLAGCPSVCRPAAEPEPPLGPLHIPPPRGGAFTVAPQLRQLTPQVWQPRGHLLSGECAGHSHPMWACPPGSASGEGRMGSGKAMVTASPARGQPAWGLA